MNRPLALFLRALDDEIMALKLLRYRRQVCALLMAADDSRYLAIAADEFLEAEENVAEQDLARALAAEDLAEFWDVSATPLRLNDLIARASDDEATQLLERQKLLQVAVQEVEILRSLTTSLATSSLELIESRTATLSEQDISRSLTYDGAEQISPRSMSRVG